MPISTTFLQDFTSLRHISSQQEQFVQLLDLYIKNFPVKNALLLRYSPIGQIGEGIIAYMVDDYKYISHYVEDLRMVPLILTALQQQRTIYVEGLDFVKAMPSKYVSNVGSSQFIVVPIFFNNVSFGYICGDSFDEHFRPTQTILEAFTNFGALTGELFLNPQPQKILLSKRELEVMQYAATGASAKEIAATINISTLTVNQYIKTAIKKLDAKNRVEAVVKLCKLGLI